LFAILDGLQFHLLYFFVEGLLVGFKVGDGLVGGSVLVLQV